ncbi:hypothetical protein [Aurantibacter aestuarii]|uniref:Lipocalin-like domain-containing protein n=1 Tax=Aurantibacter aestuarii TaxID=1266046 RepID=A0A2T1NG23_9FLAO|nr:hypothetical protein [Aurantibacter aestuarii]PSG91737.1 hypothetical protein C7H52_01075 [Aurantibacter aestuarii]
MKNITYLLLSLLFLSSTHKNHIKSIDEIIIGSWRIDSYELDYINKPSDNIKSYDYNEFSVVTYTIKGKMKYSNLKITNEKSELIDDTLASGNFTVYKKNILIENQIHKYKATGIWTSEIKVIDKNTLKKVLNFEDNGVSIDDKNIIGETVILKRIE